MLQIRNQGKREQRKCLRRVHGVYREIRIRARPFLLFIAPSVFIALGLAAVAATSVSVREMYDGTLSLHEEVESFRHIDRVFPSAVVTHGGTPHALRRASKMLQDVRFSSGGQPMHLNDYVRLNRVAGLLVLHRGEIALERYELGNDERTRWVSFSVVKSITSTLAAAAIRDGLIKGLDDPVVEYLPKLKGSAYDGASVRNVLQMASGLRWDEAYMNPQSDRRKLLDLQMEQHPGKLLEYMASRPRAAEPGTRWNYNTGETYVLGALVRAAVKRPLSQYLSEKIWAKFAMEDDATWWTESPGGVEFGGSGFAATLRDYGRFGQFVLQGGRGVVPEGWFPDAGWPKRVGSLLVPYGYMWWSEPGEAFRAYGIFGQSIYINPKRQVVIVVWSAQQTPVGSTAVSDEDFYDGVLQSLE